MILVIVGALLWPGAVPLAAVCETVSFAPTSVGVPWVIATTVTVANVFVNVVEESVNGLPEIVVTGQYVVVVRIVSVT